MRVAELHAFQDRLAQIDRGALGFDNAIDAEAITARIKNELLSLETLKLWAKNPMTYAGLPGGAIDALMKRDFAPKHDRLRSMVARLRGVPAIFAAARANVVDPAKEFTDVARPSTPRARRAPGGRPPERWRDGRPRRSYPQCGPDARPATGGTSCGGA